MADITEAAAARRKAREEFLRKKQPPWRTSPQIGEEPSAADFSSLSTPPADTSTGTGEFTPKKTKSDWKKGLSAALQGAAYGIQADIGPAVSGQQFRQGILRGVVGAGMADSARARAAALAEGKGMDLAEKLELLRAEREGEPSWGEKNAITSKQAMDRAIAANTAAEKRAALARKESTSGKTEAQLAALKTTAYKQAFDEILKNGDEPIPELIVPRYNQIYDLLLAPKPDWSKVPAPGTKK